MPTDADILTLMQWLSPAYPVGAFAYSHGLEAAIQTGMVVTGPDLQDWLGDIVVHGSGRNDCILLRAAHGARTAEALAVINDTALAFAASAERQQEATLQGAAFCKTTSAIWGGDDTPYVYPVAVGAAASRRTLDPSLTAVLFLQATLGNLVSAAQRLMSLGQTDAQAILAALMPLCQQVAHDSQGTQLDDLHSTAFLSDIAAMQHETLQPRIFRT